MPLGAAGGLPRGSTAPPRPEANITIAPPIASVAAKPRTAQRRTTGGVTLATAEPEIVDGSADPPPAAPARGPTSVGWSPLPAMRLTRCTEIVAWASDCAYLAIAWASSAIVWNRRAGSFSRQRWTIASRSPGNRTVSLGVGSLATLSTVAE